VREGRSLCCPAPRASRKKKRGKKEPEATRHQKTLYMCGHCPSRTSGTREVTQDEGGRPKSAGCKMEPDGLK